MDKTAILNKSRQFNIKLIELQFTDILGGYKGISINSRQLKKALEGRVTLDGSFINGISAAENPALNHHRPIQYQPSRPLIIARSGRGADTNIIIRNTALNFNPYLMLALIIKAGLEGVREQLLPPSADDLTGNRSSDDLITNVQAIKEDKLLQETFGSTIYSRLAAAMLEQAMFI